MKKNPEYWDADNVQVERITVQLAGDAPTQTLSFRSGELDIIGVSETTLQTDPELEEPPSEWTDTPPSTCRRCGAGTDAAPGPTGSSCPLVGDRS